ncbi:uncharacterized protein LOC143022109 [Oratosquilla oratoria]|uniref:uncharacterized protein LOC143022109 n=1 Tax=Oratosquilla oratoria TaxID=337810 RepID=UPI003F767A9B
MAVNPHNRSQTSSGDEEEDPVEKMISKTGCLEKHYSIQIIRSQEMTACATNFVWLITKIGGSVRQK